MTCRSLLVLLDNDRACDSRTEVAIRLAKSFDCHLAGVAPTGLIDVPAIPGSASSLQDLYAQTWALIREQAEVAAQRFRDMCRMAGLRAFDTVVDEGEKWSSLVRHAHCNDLLLLSRADDEPSARRPMQDLIEQVVMQSACPTLVLPATVHTGSIGKTALVAWDDSREASRAVRDALPMLRKAGQVHVLSWDETGKFGPTTLRERLDALRRWLDWQGVKDVQLNVEPPVGEISSAMLSRAADLRADLIVMGAYGHARWAERLLGGATHDLLDKAAVPLLMTH